MNKIKVEGKFDSNLWKWILDFKRQLRTRNNSQKYKTAKKTPQLSLMYCTLTFSLFIILGQHFLATTLFCVFKINFRLYFHLSSNCYSSYWGSHTHKKKNINMCIWVKSYIIHSTHIIHTSLSQLDNNNKSYGDFFFDIVSPYVLYCMYCILLFVMFIINSNNKSLLCLYLVFGAFIFLIQYTLCTHLRKKERISHVRVCKVWPT